MPKAAKLARWQVCPVAGETVLPEAHVAERQVDHGGAEEAKAVQTASAIRIHWPR